MIWITPRSKSTILLKCLSSNPAVTAIFEPFSFAYFHKFYNDLFTYDDLYKLLNQAPFNQDNIVWKDMPSFVENLDFEKWASDATFRHIFLIRHPQQVALSNIQFKGEPLRFMNFLDIFTDHTSLQENFEAMLKLIDFLSAKNIPYKVMDASEVTSSSWQHFVQSVSEFGGLPFDREQMSNMPSFSFLPDHWWTTPTAAMLLDDHTLDFHGVALQSTEYDSKPNPETSPLSKEEQIKLHHILEESIPLYEKLKQMTQ